MELIKQRDITDNYWTDHALNTLKHNREKLEQMNEELHKDNNPETLKKRLQCNLLLSSCKRAIEETEKFVKLLDQN